MPVRQFLALSLAGALAACGAPGEETLAPIQQAVTRAPTRVRSEPVPNFDWSMPQTVDLNGDGLVDMSPARGQLVRNTFDVRLDACGSLPASWGTLKNRFEFKIQRLTGDGAFDVAEPVSGTCSTMASLAQGKYSVKVTVFDQDWRAFSVTKKMDVRNFLIVSMGDSVASGEGNPEAPAVFNGIRLASEAKWSDLRCHRSALSGPAKAARALEDSDPRSSVTFLSVACSGAGIVEGLLQPYAGQQPPAPGNWRGPPTAPLPPQIDQVASALEFCQESPEICARRATPDRQIDVLLLNAGANDILFGSVVEECASPFGSCDVPLSPTNLGTGAPNTLPMRVSTAFKNLPGKFASLDQNIQARLKPKSVFITEYFDPTWDDGPTTSCNSMILTDAGPFPIDDLDGEITGPEVTWARNEVVRPLNAQVAKAATAFGWSLVGGIADEFVGHGYCADDHWIVRFDEALRRQANRSGTMHPNGAGQDVYGRQLGRRLIQALGSKNKADFNRDAAADMLWIHPETGNISPWHFFDSNMNGTTAVSAGVVPLQVPSTTGWEVAATADFNNDGFADLLWYNPPSGQLSMWWMRGIDVLGTVLVDSPLIPGNSGWRILGTGDFDHDGRMDAVWKQAGTTNLAVQTLDNNGARSKSFAPIDTSETSKTIFAGNFALAVNASEWELVGTGDFDSNGDVDFLWRKLTNGALVVWLSQGLKIKAQMLLDFRAPAPNTGWKVVGVDDYDADSMPDLLWYHGATGTLVIWRLNEKGERLYSSLVDGNVVDSFGWKVASR